MEYVCRFVANDAMSSVFIDNKLSKLYMYLYNNTIYAYECMSIHSFPLYTPTSLLDHYLVDHSRVEGLVAVLSSTFFPL